MVLAKKDIELVFNFFEDQKKSNDYIHKFEEAIAKFIGMDYSIALNSCTSSLTLVLKFLGINEKSEVIVPSCTFPASVNPVVNLGAKAVFVDIECETYALDYSLIEKKITNNTKAIILVHQFGFSAKHTQEIVDLGNRYNIPVVEDVARSFGASLLNKKCGSFGIAGCFSFNSMKILSTEYGGAIVTNDRELYEKCKVLRGYGDFDKQFIEAGYNYKMGSINAYIGYQRMKNINDNIKKRRVNAQFLINEIKGIKGISIPSYSTNCVYQSFPLKIDNETLLPAILLYLKENNIKVYINQIVNKEPFFEKLESFDESQFKNSQYINTHLICLQWSHLFSNDFLIKISTLLKKFYERKN